MKSQKIILVVLVIFVVSGILFGMKIFGLSWGKNNIETNTSNATREILVKTGESPIFGKYLTDAKGIALYTFSEDTESKSNCSGECLGKWKIYEFDNISLVSITDELSRKVRVMTREDGFQQFTFNMKPLYYYIGDENPGEINGVDEKVVGSKWSLVLLND